MSAMGGLLSALWNKSRDRVLERVTVIDAAASALRSGGLDMELRATAEREAHRLAGVAGTFGFWDATDLAREAEGMFAGTEAISRDAVERLTEIARLLRAQLIVAATE